MFKNAIFHEHNIEERASFPMCSLPSLSRYGIEPSLQVYLFFTRVRVLTANIEDMSCWTKSGCEKEREGVLLHTPTQDKLRRLRMNDMSEDLAN